MNKYKPIAKQKVNMALISSGKTEHLFTKTIFLSHIFWSYKY